MELGFAPARCSCRARLPDLDRLRSAAVYEGPLERAVHRLKYEGWRALAPALTGILAERLAADALPASRIVAVPLHPRRRRQRGYNQSELLATGLRRRMRLGLEAGALERVRDTPPQVGLDRLRRRDNMVEAFRWCGPPLGGEPVMVVDDVVTTGATLQSCAAALRSAGAGSVFGLTLARVRL